jgi:hypothetical protein
MVRRGAIQRVLARIPAGWAVALGFCAFVGGSLLVARMLPPVRDPVAECAKECAPRHGRLVNDMNYPMSKGKYAQVCKCT